MITFYVTNTTYHGWQLDEPEKLDPAWSYRRETRTLIHRCHGGDVDYEFNTDRFQCPGCDQWMPRYLHFVVKAAKASA